MKDIQELMANEGVFSDILGQQKTKDQLRSTLLMGRHVLIVGEPGIGKTTLVKSLAKHLPDLDVEEKGEKKTLKGTDRLVRVQGSPDLTAEDLIGDIDPVKALEFGPLSMEAFTPGKIFKANNGILFFDEVNRCPERLQNALLQVLQEGVATIGSYDVDIPTNFVFIGTMNPEDTNTEKLSTVFLDRFDVVYMHYPETLQIEKDIVLQFGKQIEVKFPAQLLDQMIYFIRKLRTSDKILKKPSVRATLGLYERAQSNAYLLKKGEVEYADIQDAIHSVLTHRIELKPNVKYLQTPREFIEDQLSAFEGDLKKGKLNDLNQEMGHAEREGDSP